MTNPLQRTENFVGGESFQAASMAAVVIWRSMRVWTSCPHNRSAVYSPERPCPASSPLRAIAARPTDRAGRGVVRIASMADG
jgi:hypothetical protein